MNKVEKKAWELYKKYKLSGSYEIIDFVLSENLDNFNQGVIDFWLDVRLEVKKLAEDKNHLSDRYNSEGYTF